MVQDEIEISSAIGPSVVFSWRERAAEKEERWKSERGKKSLGLETLRLATVKRLNDAVYHDNSLERAENIATVREGEKWDAKEWSADERASDNDLTSSWCSSGETQANRNG